MWLNARVIGADDHPHVYYPMDDPRLQSAKPVSKNVSIASENDMTVCTALGPRPPAHTRTHARAFLVRTRASRRHGEGRRCRAWWQVKPALAPSTNVYYRDKKAAMESALSEAVSGPRESRCVRAVCVPFTPLSRRCSSSQVHAAISVKAPQPVRAFH